MSQNPNYPSQPEGQGAPQQPNYGAPQGAPQGGYQPAPVQQDPGQTLGILSIVGAFLIPIAGLILGIFARKKSREAGYEDNTLGKWGFILSIIFLVLGIIGTVIYIIVIVAAVNAGVTY